MAVNMSLCQHRIEGAVRQGGKGVIGGCEHREWSIAAECLNETSSDHCGFEGVVVLAVDDMSTTVLVWANAIPPTRTLPRREKNCFMV